MFAVSRAGQSLDSMYPGKGKLSLGNSFDMCYRRKKAGLAALLAGLVRPPLPGRWSAVVPGAEKQSRGLLVIRYFSSFGRGCALLSCALTLISLAACGASSAAGNAGLESGGANPQSAAQGNTVAAPATVAAAPACAVTSPPAAVSPAPVPGQIAACWLPLVQRLQNDPAVSPAALQYFCALPEYSASPMGAKIKELFTSAYLRKPRTEGPRLPPSRIYRNVVTTATMSKCNAFLTLNKPTCDAVEKKYPVPREILVSLLFVETRLGTYVGKDNAFWSLACMAAADNPELVKAGLRDIPIKDEHNVWLQAKLTDKSGWAYKELRALLTYCSTQNLDPHSIPGSVYGAIGLCQFMPSNLVPYAADGDGDGVINLFSGADAIFSAARYLTKHGWKAGAGVEAQRKVLKRYNNLNIYANTILALAESLRTGVVQTGPPDAPKVKTASSKPQGGKKAAASSGKPKKSNAKAAASKKAPTKVASSAKKGDAAQKKSSAASTPGKTAAASGKATPKGALP